MMLNAFNWDFIRDCPLPERQPAYVAQIITPCKIRTLKATEFARGRIAPPTKVADTNKSQALRMAGI